MTGLKEKMTSFFTSGPAAIVAGAALIALGAAMSAGAGAIMSGGSARGGGYSPSPSAVGGRGMVDSLTTYRFNPTTMDMTKVNPVQPVQFTIIGTADVKAQNDIAEMVARAQRRGGGRG